MIYFLRNGKSIKVGYSSNVDRRVNALRTALPRLELIGTMLGERDHERTLHRMLAEHKIDREWFSDVPFVRGVIREAIAFGVSRTPSLRNPSSAPLCPSTVAAQRLASIVLYGKPKTMAKSCTIGGIPSSTLHKLRYRPDNQLSTSEYFNLLRAARSSLAEAMRVLEDDLDFIDGLEQSDAKQDNLLFDATRQVAFLERELDQLRKGIPTK